MYRWSPPKNREKKGGLFSVSTEKKKVRTKRSEEKRFAELCRVAELRRPALSRATASLDVRRRGLRLVSPSRAPHGKVRCITSHQSQPPLHNQWSRLAYLVCVPLWPSGPLLTRFATSYLCSAEAGKMGSAPPPAGKQVSPVYIDTYMCEHACVSSLLLSAHIFIGTCIHLVRYRHALMKRCATWRKAYADVC